LAKNRADESLVLERRELAVDYSYLAELVGHNLGIAYVMVCQVFARVFKDLDMTPKQFVALEFISKNPHVSQKDIATHIGTTPTAMVAIMDNLTERGFLERGRSQADRRRHEIRLTQDGQAILGDLRRRAFEVEDAFAADANLSPDERKRLLCLLRKITRR
jgi:DNA-binding MarR family transcriptional regulator